MFPSVFSGVWIHFYCTTDCVGCCSTGRVLVCIVFGYCLFLLVECDLMRMVGIGNGGFKDGLLELEAELGLLERGEYGIESVIGGCELLGYMLFDRTGGMLWNGIRHERVLTMERFVVGLGRLCADEEVATVRMGDGNLKGLVLFLERVVSRVKRERENGRLSPVEVRHFVVCISRFGDISGVG